MTESLLAYIKYYFNAQTIYKCHSPEIYSLIHHCIEDDRSFYIFRDIDRLHFQLKQSKEQIAIEDHGAGSRVKNAKTLSEIADSAASDRKKGQLIYKIVEYYQCQNVLELGTNLGIGTAYLASAPNIKRVDTIEGDPTLCRIAETNITSLKIKNVRFHQATFDTKLPHLLRENSYDLIFIDGNHQYDPTLKYTKLILDNLKTDIIVIYDDIRWSGEMARAWEEIKKLNQVSLILDLGSVGVVKLSAKVTNPRAEFTYVPYWYKPWQIGLFS